MTAKKILVAEDEPDIQTLLILALQHMGYEVVTAEDGQEAYEMALKEIPDLVLMDVRMPIMNGYDACKAIKAAPKTQHVPVMLLSVRGAEAIQLGYAAGAVEYVVKPFALDRLMQRVSELVTH